jgi:hypothetical protein
VGDEQPIAGGIVDDVVPAALAAQCELSDLMVERSRGSRGWNREREKKNQCGKAKNRFHAFSPIWKTGERGFYLKALDLLKPVTTPITVRLCTPETAL